MSTFILSCFIAHIYRVNFYAVVFHSTQLLCQLLCGCVSYHTSSVSTFMLSSFIAHVFRVNFYAVVFHNKYLLFFNNNHFFMFQVHCTSTRLNRDYWRVRAALPTSCVWPNVTSFLSSKFIPVLFKNNSIHFLNVIYSFHFVQVTTDFLS